MPRALWVKAPIALLRHRVGLLAVAAAAFLVAVGAAAGPLMNAAVESEALQSKLAQLTPLAAGLVIDRPQTLDRGDGAAVAAADQRRRRGAVALGRTLPSVGRPVLTSWTDTEITQPAFSLGNPVEVVPMSRTNATKHVQRLTGTGSGVWLSSTIAFARDADGKVTFGLPGPGERKITLPVGAVYRSLGSALGNPYWVNFTGRIRAVNPDHPPPPTFVFVTTTEIYRLAHNGGGAVIGNDFEFPIVTRSMTPGRAREIARAFEHVKRQLAAHTPLAVSIGCDGLRRPCQVSSELTDAVRVAAAGNSSLRPVVDLLAGFCVLIALGAALIAGVFTGRRRVAEARLSLVGGEPPSLFLVRAALEAFLPAMIGAGAGFAVAVEAVRLFTPEGSVDAGTVREAAFRGALSVVAATLVVGIGVTLARGRLGTGRPAWRTVSRVPWELAAAAAALASWLVLASGGGLVKDRVAGSHPRLVVLLLPALVAAPASGIAGRALRSIVLRRVSVASVTPFLALRRVGAARGLVVALTVTVAAGVASLAFAQILQSSLASNSTEKAFVSNGSDVQGLIDPGRVLPSSFPYPVTKVAEVFDAGRLATGESFEAIVVDPASLARVLAPHWSRDVSSGVRALATSRARLPALAVGVAPGPQTLTIGNAQTAVEVVARVRAFPGMQPSQPLLVFPARALRSPPEALNYIWATGPPRQVEAALAHSSLAPSYLTKVADFSRSPDVANITRTYGFLRIVASAIVLLALVALMLYLSGRERSQLVTSAFLRRMGVSQGRQAWSVALESGVLVAVAAAVGLAAALVTAGAIIGHVDPLSQYSPAPVTEVPWRRLVATGLGVIVVAGLVGSMLTLIVKRAGVGEDLRVS